MRAESVPAYVRGLPGQSFLESVAGRRSNRPATVSLSLFLHLTVATAVTVSTTFILNDPIEPPLRKIAWFTMAPSVPSGGSSKPPAARTEAPKPPAVPAKVFQPVAIQPEIPVSSAVTEETGPVATGPYVEGGFEETGPPGGTGILGPGSTEAPVVPVADAPVHITSDIDEPVEIFRLNPVYPEAARRAKIEGTVILQAVIARSGEVESVGILRSAHPLLDRAALDAVPQWRYKPARLNGRPLAVYLTVTVHFHLR